MKIGITINNILRDHISQVIAINKSLTDRDPIEPINPFNLEKSFPEIKSKVSYQEFNQDPSFELTEYEEDDGFNLNQLMYFDASFEIFGRSEIVDKNIFLKLKQIEKKLGVEFIFLNKESDKSRNATLFFLSKNNFIFKQIIFPDKYKEFWDHVDILITDNPKILKYRPEDKVSIKYNNDFNKGTRSDYQIDNLDQLYNLLKRIIKNK